MQAAAGYLVTMPTPVITPEAQLVFGTARLDREPEETAAVAARIVDWGRVAVMAERELATHSLWLDLKAAGVATPPGFLEALGKSALQTDLRMQQLARRLAQSVEGLAAQGIPCLLLKGAAIGALGDPTFRRRPMTDLDIMVRREDAQRASEVLLNTGWSVTTNPVYLEMLKDAHHLPHFVDALQPGVRLELHVSLMPDDQPFAFDDAALWQDARSAQPPFAGAQCPSPEHLLLHACLHFAWQHRMNFGAWRTFRAVAEVTRMPGFEWERFTSIAAAARAGTTCYWTLRLAGGMGGVSAPPEMLRRLEPPTPEWARRALERHFVAEIDPGEGPPSPSSKLRNWLWEAALRPEWSGHVRRGHGDRDRRWVEAYGATPPESGVRRFARHVANSRAWARYLFRTLLP